MVVTSGIISAAIEEVAEAGSAEMLRSALDEPRLYLRTKAQTIGYSVDITLAKVDPALIELLTGQPLVTNASGDVVGNDAQTRLPVANFAMEVWTNLAGGACTTPTEALGFGEAPFGEAPFGGLPHGSGGPRYGYTLFPHLRGGRVSGFSFANEAVTFNVSGARTVPMQKWGTGPYGVLCWYKAGWDEHGWDEEPGLPVVGNVHWRNQITNFAPTPLCGAQPLVLESV